MGTLKKADEALESVKDDFKKTTKKIQKVIDEGDKTVKLILRIGAIALGVSILANIINIGAAITNHKKLRGSIIVHNLYLGDKK